MNLSKLFKLQKALDAPYSHVEDRLSKDILWLMEELGELAREWRGHKYRRPKWDQQPVTEMHKDCKICDGAGCKLCYGTGHRKQNPLLEEYTDCLSIILSIWLQIEYPCTYYDYELSGGNPTPLIDFLNVFEFGGSLICSATSYNPKCDDVYQDYGDMTKFFLDLGYSLGFTYEQIETNYIAKAEANAKRNS